MNSIYFRSAENSNDTCFPAMPALFTRVPVLRRTICAAYLLLENGACTTNFVVKCKYRNYALLSFYLHISTSD